MMTRALRELLAGYLVAALCAVCLEAMGILP